MDSHPKVQHTAPLRRVEASDHERQRKKKVDQVRAGQTTLGKEIEKNARCGRKLDVRKSTEATR
jgi:hypothetical protein